MQALAEPWNRRGGPAVALPKSTNELSYRDALAVRVLVGIGEADEAEARTRLPGVLSGSGMTSGAAAGVISSLPPVAEAEAPGGATGTGAVAQSADRLAAADDGLGGFAAPDSGAALSTLAADSFAASQVTKAVAGAPLTTSPATSQPQAVTAPPSGAPSAHETLSGCSQSIVLPVDSLDGWSVERFGGTAPAEGGAMAASGSLTLREGNSFLTTLERTFYVGLEGMTLTFAYEELAFDTSSTGRMKDAFEVALVGEDGETLVHAFASDRETFINFSENEPVALAQGVTQTGNQVTLDLADVFADTTAMLSFRLVNNDGDTGTQVRISDVRLTGGGGGCAPQASLSLLNDTAPVGPDVAPFQTDRLTNDPRVTGTVSDDQGIALVQIGVDGGSLQDITDTEQNGQFTFNPGVLAAGAHAVLLRVTDADGQAAEATLEFTVNAPPVANAGGNRTVPEGSVVNFDAGGSTDADAPIYSYQWTLDESSTVTGPLATRTFPQQGQFTVNLAVTDTAGSTATADATVTVENAPPVIAPLAGQTIDEGASVSLTATFTDAGVLDLHTAQVDWGDGTVEAANVTELAGLGTVTASHLYRENGDYAAALTVSDAEGGSASQPFVVHVRNRAPLITEVNAPSGQEGSSVALLASFTDAGVLDAHSASVTWSDGSVTPGIISEIAGQGTVSASHTYADNASYPVSLTVSDDDGDRVTQSLTAAIGNAPPVVTPAGNQTIGIGALLDLEVATFVDPGFTSPPAGTAETFLASIDWGDGSPVELGDVSVVNGTVGVLTRGAVHGAHSYSSAGNYQVTVTVRDDDQGQASASFQVVVQPVAANSCVYVVPGNAGELMEVTFNWVARDATYNNELGIYPLDAATGAVNGLSPGQAGYAQAALMREQQRIVFTTSDTAGAVAKMTVPAGTLWSPYLVQNSTRDQFLTKNAANALGVSPRSWFCFTGANPDGSEHFRRTDLPSGAVQFAVEDLTSGGDQDFNDLVFTISAAPVAAQPHAKFVTVDSGSDKAFRYDAAGAAGSASILATADNGPRGVTMTEAGDRYWVIDGNKQVYVYHADGSLRGVWRPGGLSKPVGIATDEADLWILDRDYLSIKRYASGAARTFGNSSATSSFKLHADNTTPTDMAGDGTRIWVTDDGRNEVFIYSASGQYLGRWKLDTKNADPAGITHEPGSGTNLWVADRVDDRVYKYTGGEAWVSGTRMAASSFALASGNGTVEGIADPPGDYLGTEFWIMSPDYVNQVGRTSPIYIAGPTATQGVLEIPGFGYSQSFSVTPGVVTEVLVPRILLSKASGLNTNSDLIEDTAVRITSQHEVTVTVTGNPFGRATPNGSYLALPLDVLGSEYMVMSYRNGYGVDPDDAAGTGTTLRIVAPFDDTVISIIPSQYIVDIKPTWKEPFTITLDRGQVYTLPYVGDNVLDYDDDFTGTRIIADRPIVVYGENFWTKIPDGVDHFGGWVLEQLPSVSDWEKEFLAVPPNKIDYRDYSLAIHATEPEPVHLLRFLAAEDGTVVTVNGTTVASLDAGEYHELQFYEPVHILANKPILTTQFTGDGDSNIVDEYMTLVPGVAQYLPTYEVLVPSFMNSLSTCGTDWGAGLFSCYVGWINLTVPQSAVASLTIDGSPVGSVAAVSIGNTGFVSLQIDALPGHHRIQAAVPFGAILYGFGMTHGIGHPAGIKFVDRNATPSLAFVSPQALAAIGGEVELVVRVTGTSGLTLEGVEVSLNVTGANPRQLVSITNAAGEAVFRYVGSNAGLDHLTAAVDGATAETDLVWADLTLQVEVYSPASETSFDAGVTSLVSGRVTAAAPYARPAAVRINGTPVDALDAQGNFFARRAVGPGTNAFLVEAVDTLGQTAATTIDLIGSTIDVQADIFGRTSDVTGSLRERYGRTSFNRASGIVFTEIAVENAGQYEVDAPLVVEVSGLSDPSVRVRGEDGASLSGNAYFDLSQQLAGQTLTPTKVTDRRDLRFALNAPQQFAFDLLIRGQLNRVPEISSVPPVTVSVGSDYQYNVAASDPDGNALTFRLEAAPAGMIIGETIGAITWSPTGADLGTHQMTVVVDDHRGGSAEQGFTLSVREVPPNRPPVIRSFPPVSANVLSPYQYALDVADPDSTQLTIHLLEAPAGMTVDDGMRSLGWTPDATQIGEHSVRLRVQDEFGAEATQEFVIAVQQAIGNAGPLFTSVPNRSLLPGQSFDYSPRVYDANEDVIEIQLAAHPDEMTWDATFGELRWTPTAEQTRRGVGGLVSAGLDPTAYQASSFNEDIETPIVDAPESAFDGDLDTVWRPDPSHAWPQWLEVDLGADLNVANLSLVASQTAAGPGVYEIWASDSPIGASVAGARLLQRIERTLSDGETLTLAVAPSRARFVQVRSLDAPTQAGWREVQIFAASESFPVALLATDGRGGSSDQQFELAILDAQPGEIRGTIFDDANANRLRDELAGDLEQAIPGWTVFLDNNRNGQLDDGEPETLTDAAGNYIFTNVPPGSTVVRQRGRLGWTQTAPADGGAHEFELLEGQAVSGFEFGLTGGSLTNRAPAITSLPSIDRVPWDGLFEYQVTAFDEDGDELAFDLPVDTRNGRATIDGSTGRFLFAPGPQCYLEGPFRIRVCRVDQSFDFLIRVRDNNKGVVFQIIRVTAVGGNTAPIIHSTPPAAAFVDVPYVTETIAQDAEGDAVSYSLALHPPGMLIDGASGRITWTPSIGQVGTHAVEIIAQDSRYGEGRQAFTITTHAFQVNVPLVITSRPRTLIPPLYPYKYRLAATDSTNDPIAFAIETAPTGIVLNGDTLFWDAKFVLTDGVFPVTIRAEDGRGGIARQSFELEVSSVALSGPMQIVSSPPLTAIVGKLYEYDLRAVDDDCDPAIWALATRVPGMTFDERRGTIRWIPTLDQVGDHPVRVLAVGAAVKVVEQAFEVTVLAKEPAPLLTSIPETTAYAAQTYVYAVRTDDRGSGKLTFSLGERPAGMTIDFATGLILWTPDASQVGNHSVLVRATSSTGARVTQYYTLQVTANAQPFAPAFVSTPPRVTPVSSQYIYHALATDPDGEALAYLLPVAPQGMTIDASSGHIGWLPGPGQAGTHAVVIEAIDTSGNRARQGYQMVVTSDNLPPEITSSPPDSVLATAEYRYDLRTSDADGDRVSFALFDSPDEMSIDQFGRLRWQPGVSEVGGHSVEVIVSDGRGANVVQTFAIQVLADTVAPAVSLEVQQSCDDSFPIALGVPVAIIARAVDNVALTDLRVTVDGGGRSVPITLGPNGQGSFVAPILNVTYTFTAIATDASNNVTQVTSQVLVRPPSDCGLVSDTDAPIVGITAPAWDTTITDATDVIGTVQDDNLAYYTVEYANTL